MADTVMMVGGSTGIGLACARRLRAAGVEVVAAARHAGGLAELGVAVQDFDVLGARPLQVPERLAGFVYFPGTITLKPFHRLNAADFEHDWRVNCLGAATALQAALPALRANGSASVVLFSTVAVGQGMAFHASVAAAKGAVEGLARALAAELAPAIRVNVVAPSLTDTPLAASLLNSEAKREAAAKRHPLERVGQPEEVAELVAYLLGDGSRGMTGQVLRPDGGLSSVRLF